MKYIITESRLETLKYNYLGDSLSDIQEYQQEIDGDEYHWWGTEESAVFGLDENEGKLGIGFDKDYISSLSLLFGISEDESKRFLINWIIDNLGIKPEFEFESKMF